MDNKYKYFNKAFEDWTGTKWNWKKEDNTKNHPMDSDDLEIRAFYQGFRYAKKGQGSILNEMSKLKSIEMQLSNFKQDLKKFRKGYLGKV